MTCKEVAEFLMDYLDEALPQDVRNTFEEHLKVCSACRRYLDSYRKTIAMGKKAFADEGPCTEVPEELVQTILRARATKP